MTEGKLKVVIVSHVVALLLGTVFSFLIRSNWYMDLAFTALFSAQLSLISMVAAFAKHAVHRLLILLLGNAYLFVVGVTVNDCWGDNLEALAVLLFIVVPTSMAFLCFILIGRRIAIRKGKQTDKKERFRFSILHLLLTTAAIACVLVVGLVVRKSETVVVIPTIIELLVFAGFLGLIVVLVSTMNAWATFSNYSCAIRWAFATTFAVIIGMIPPFFSNDPPFRYISWPTLTASTSLLILLSLAPFRANGYRIEVNSKRRCAT